MIEQNKLGGRTVHLFIPFEHNGKKIESITLAPLRFGHVLRWNEGKFKTMIELMTDLAGVDVAVIRDLRYPDADRVMEAFMAMLTPEIRDDVASGRIPQEVLVEEATEEPARVTNGSGAAREVTPPGVPLPPQEEVGFDMTEEP